MRKPHQSTTFLIFALLISAPSWAGDSDKLGIDIHTQAGGGGTFQSEGHDNSIGPIGVDNLNVFDQLVFAKTPADRAAVLSKAKDSLSFDQKIGVLSYLLGTFGNHYDEARKDQGANAPGTVTLDQLLDCVRDFKNCGVCRDIHAAGAQIAKALGIKVAYVMSFSSNQGGHADLMVQAPDGRLILLDYGYAAYQKNTNPSAGVVQNTQLTNVGIRNTVYDSNGKAVADLPTDLGVLLHQMTDQPLSDLDPLARGDVNQVATGGKTLLKHIRIFAAAGTTPTGNQAQGTGITASADSRELIGGPNSAYVSFRGAVMLYKNTNTVADLQQKIQSQGFYSNLHAEVGTPALTKKLDSGATLSVRGKAVGNFELQSAYSLTDSPLYMPVPANQSIDSRLNYGSGAEARYCSPDGKTMLNGEVMVLGGVAFRSVTDATQGVGPFLQGMEYKVGAKHEINPSTALIGDATIVQRRAGLGTQGRFTLGVLEKYHGFTYGQTIGVEGPIGSRAPAFLPGSQRRVDLGASVMDPTETYTLGARTSCPVGMGLRSCYLGGSLDMRF